MLLAYFVDGDRWEDCGAKSGPRVSKREYYDEVDISQK